MEQPATIKFRRRTDRRRLTKRTVEAMPAPAATAWVYDERTPRLAICLQPTGTKSWYWVGRIDGRMARVKLGGFPELTPDNARKAAQATSSDVAKGKDPRRDKARGEWTLGRLLELYLERKPNPNKKQATYDQDRLQFDRYCGRLKSRPVATIKRAAIFELHSTVGRNNGHYAANRLLALLSTLYGFANEIDAYTGPNPCKGVRRFREEERDRFLDAAELKRLFDALDDEPDLFRDFFTLAIFTGARRGNLLAMRFDQIDFDGAIWRIPQTKSGESLRVALVPEAVDILRRRRESVDGEFVFPSRRKGSPHLTDPMPAWRRIRKRAGIEDVRIHDLRRTLGSWQAATGASLPVIGKSLGHRNQSTTAIYARLNIDPVRASVNAAVAAMKGGEEE